MSRRDDRISLTDMRIYATKAIDIMGETSLSDVIAMRNRLVHGYDTIDLSILWNSIRNDLPPLIEQLKALLREGA